MDAIARLETQIAELTQLYQATQREVAERAEADQGLRAACDELEKRIQQCTANLADAHLQLRQEIQDHSQAEAEILRLRHLLQSITDSMPSALITLDHFGQVLTWNLAAEALTGQAAGQVLGRLVWQACPPLVRYRDLFDQVLSHGQVAHRFKEQVETELGLVYRDVSVFPLLGAVSSRLEGVALRIDDATRRVNMEESVLQSAKMASVGRLAAGVAHELNNPLGAMMLSAQMLQRILDLDSARTRERLQGYGVDVPGLARYWQAHEVSDYLQGIRTCGERAAKIVSDLLSFSRPSLPQTLPHDFNALVRQTLELAATDYDLKKKYDFRDIEIVYDLATDLPELICDGQQIQQVVLNLVRNAAQAMADHKGEGLDYRPRLALHTSRQAGWLRLEVEDNGPGIPEAVRSRLFEPFFTTKAVGQGSGLGLWLCWSIVVEHHGGQIRVDPVGAAGEAGETSGSRFVVELPLR